MKSRPIRRLFQPPYIRCWIWVVKLKILSWHKLLIWEMKSWWFMKFKTKKILEWHQRYSGIRGPLGLFPWSSNNLKSYNSNKRFPSQYTNTSDRSVCWNIWKWTSGSKPKRQEGRGGDMGHRHSPAAQCSQPGFHCGS